MVLVLEEVMHPEPEVVQIELAEVLPRDGKRIKIVFLEIAAELPAPLLVFSPNEASGEENNRGDDGRDNVDSDFVF